MFRDFKIVSENELRDISNYRLLSNFSKWVQNLKLDNINKSLYKYNKIIIEEVISRNKMTYNAILTLTIQLLEDYPKLLNFYRRLYTKIIIDEFQDINYLNYRLIELLMHENLIIEVYGDSLQRIYGFIGTIPNIFDEFGERYKFNNYKLNTNYRFKNNINMLKLEKRIRNFVNYPIEFQNPLYTNNFNLYSDHSSEINGVTNKIQKLLEKEQNKKIAILTSQRGKGINSLKKRLKSEKIDYFNALSLDTESEKYKEFCYNCASSFNDYFYKTQRRRILKEKLNSWYRKFSEIHYSDDPEIRSFFTLLRTCLKETIKEETYRRKTHEEKFVHLHNIFIERSLHRFLSKVESRVHILTIHTSKGLEWDYVFLINIEQNKLPNKRSMCQHCLFADDCNFVLDETNQRSFLEELSVFYVAVTRAKSNLYMSASQKDSLNRAVNLSCILTTINLKPNLAVQQQSN